MYICMCHHSASLGLWLMTFCQRTNFSYNLSTTLFVSVNVLSLHMFSIISYFTTMCQAQHACQWSA